LSYMLPIDQEAELRAIPSASVQCGDTAKAFDLIKIPFRRTERKSKPEHRRFVGTRIRLYWRNDHAER
jgi:hypothetical protein